MHPSPKRKPSYWQRKAQQMQQSVGAPCLQQYSTSRQHMVSLAMHPMHPSPKRKPSYWQKHASQTLIASLSSASPSPSPIAPISLWETFSTTPSVPSQPSL